MARWTVTDDGQVMVIEATHDGRVSVDIPSGPPFITGTDGVRDIRTKLGLAAGEAQRRR